VLVPKENHEETGEASLLPRLHRCTMQAPAPPHFSAPRPPKQMPHLRQTRRTRAPFSAAPMASVAAAMPPPTTTTRRPSSRAALRSTLSQVSSSGGL
jgi:hypothetical protein